MKTWVPAARAPSRRRLKKELGGWKRRRMTDYSCRSASTGSIPCGGRAGGEPAHSTMNSADANATVENARVDRAMRASKRWLKRRATRTLAGIAGGAPASVSIRPRENASSTARGVARPRAQPISAVLGHSREHHVLRTDSTTGEMRPTHNRQERQVSLASPGLSTSSGRRMLKSSPAPVEVRPAPQQQRDDLVDRQRSPLARFGPSRECRRPHIGTGRAASDARCDGRRTQSS